MPSYYSIMPFGEMWGCFSSYYWNMPKNLSEWWFIKSGTLDHWGSLSWRKAMELKNFYQCMDGDIEIDSITDASCYTQVPSLQQNCSQSTIIIQMIQTIFPVHFALEYVNTIRFDLTWENWMRLHRGWKNKWSSWYAYN